MTRLQNILGIQPTNTRQYKAKPLRRLKVRESYYEYQLKQHYFERTPIAEIKLKGRWLVAAGFAYMDVGKKRELGAEALILTHPLLFRLSRES